MRGPIGVDDGRWRFPAVYPFFFVGFYLSNLAFAGFGRRQR